jgi:hypothetical protein
MGVYIANVGVTGVGFVDEGTIGDLESGKVWLFISGVLTLLALVSQQVGK